MPTDHCPPIFAIQSPLGFVAVEVNDWPEGDTAGFVADPSGPYSFVSQRLAIRQATVKAGLKTLPTS
jgi:hypothetical protein